VPSEWENFPLVIPEAFACGLTAIATDTCSAVGDLLVDGSTGYVMCVGDVARLSDRLRVLRDEPEVRSKLNAAARARIDEWGPSQNASAFATACVKVTST